MSEDLGSKDGSILLEWFPERIKVDQSQDKRGTGIAMSIPRILILIAVNLLRFSET